jgi:hypothetical protein
MWPFRKPAVVEVEVTTNSFSQWLRAHRPPWRPFFAMSYAERERLAEIGDAFRIDSMVALGHVLRNPEAAQVGAAALAGDDAADAELAGAIASGLLAKLAAEKPQRAATKPTMAGALSKKPGRIP